MRKIIIAVLMLAALAGVLVSQRHVLGVYAMSAQAPYPLLPIADEGPGVRWHDDYFTVQALDAQTFVIGEPRYFQQVFSYLILGERRAVLFDAGPGMRDVRGVAESLTDLPITFLPSHFHYDHVGNAVTFERVAVVDLPYLRERAPDNRLRLRFSEHLGAAERIDAPTLRVTEWLAPGSMLELGGRSLRVLYTPGHTEDSISLLDSGSGQLFVGDFVYPGELYAFLPNSGLGDYQQGARTLLGSAVSDTRIFPAHRVTPPGAPELAMTDVVELQTALAAIRAGELEGEGVYPVMYPVNARMQLLADPPWLQNWVPRHPELKLEQELDATD